MKKNSTESSWRKTKAPTKRRKLNDTAYKANPEFRNENLPIHSRRLGIMNTLACSQVIIVQGDTGCGKTTQIPQFILQDYPDSRIVVTQPRRLAAVGVATRVSKELNTHIGGLVGYHIRGEKTYTGSSKIVFMTTGMFIQEIVGSRSLEWTHIILDEVHERAIETEFLLVILKHFLYNSNTKLVLMSATIDAKLFANYFADSELKRISQLVDSDDCENWNFLEEEKEDAAPIRLAGPRNFTVKEIYLDEILEILADNLILTSLELEEISAFFRGELVSIDQTFYKIAASLIRAQHLDRIYEETAPQTFLIFLPGIHEILKLAKIIAEDVMKDHSEEIEIRILHSSIPEESHNSIFKNPKDKRRIIISTNIAESSITLPDVRYIIDFGLTKELTFNSTTKCEKLQMQWACKAVMQQRAGRAGRVAEGVCFRLMKQDFYNALRNHSVPEIQRCPLDKLILKIKQLELGSPSKILSRAIQPPNMNEVKTTEKYLKEMGALNDEDKLTWIGRVYADMPCDVKVSRLCLFGYIFGCLHESLIIGSIMSQEKSLFVNCAHLDFRHAQHEASRHAKRLMWDHFNNSDPIAGFSAYKAWYSAYGKNYTRNMKKKCFAHTKRQEVPLAEKNWCKFNALDYNVLREISVTYQELKRRLKFMGLAKEHLVSRLAETEENVMTIKLCIAAAFNEKYLTSFYSSEDEVLRRKKEQLLKDRQFCKVIIPAIPQAVTASDLREILKPTRAKSLDIEIDRENAIITFDPVESVRPLQMCLWLGSFPQRFRCGNFVVAKKTLQDKAGRVLEELPIENLDQVLARVAHSQPREGMKIEVDHSKLGEKFVHIDAYCINKPEFIYKLSFQDFITGSVITLDDFSVCKIALEEQASFEKAHMAICCEMIEKRSRTVASNVTLMPSVPILPHLLSLVFVKDISLLESNQRYSGVKIGTSELKFNYTFTGKDIEEINQIRKEISEALFDQKGILDPRPLTVKEKLVKLIRKKRLPYIDEKWRDLIFRKNEVVENCDEKSEDCLVETGPEAYLKPLKKLSRVQDDARYWSEEGQKDIELEMMKIRTDKEKIVMEIKQRARVSKITRPEIICKICKSTICAYFNCLPVNVTPVSGKFKLNCIFGSVRFEKDFPEDMITEEFVMNIDDDVLSIEEWALCMEGHLIGWKVGQNCFVSHKSCLSLLLINGEEIDWGSHLWRTGYNGFIKFCKDRECTFESKKLLKIDMDCPICKHTYNEPNDFFYHVIVSKEHTENVTKFLREGY